MITESAAIQQLHIIRDIDIAERMIDMHGRSSNPHIFAQTNRWKSVKSALCADYMAAAETMARARK